MEELNSSRRMADDSDAGLRPSVRMLEAFQQIGDDEIDFFADNSPQSSARKAADRKGREIDNHFALQFSKRDGKLKSSEIEIPSVDTFTDPKKAGLGNTMTTTMDKTDCILKSKDQGKHAAKKEIEWHSPDSSYSSNYPSTSNRQINDLGKIKEVSFEHSSARPSYKTNSPEAPMKEELVFKYMAVPKLSRAKIAAEIKPEELQKKRVDLNLDKLKKRYLSKVSPSGEKSRKSLSKEPLFEVDEFISSKNTEGESSCLKPKYFKSKEVRKMSIHPKRKDNPKNDSFKSAERKRKGSSSLVKVFGNKSYPRSVRNSDLSETFSNISNYDPLGRKSTNIISHLRRANSPKESSFGVVAKVGFVRIKDKLREHMQAKEGVKSPLPYKNFVERKTCPGSLFEKRNTIATKKDHLLAKSNLFRDPLIKPSPATNRKISHSTLFSQSNILKGHC